ncbi:MAG: AraC family transcriptional regulator [Burkholderiales bacterium]|nr:AraC family transcriptional regulator [Burkholderiales bacterium]
MRERAGPPRGIIDAEHRPYTHGRYLPIEPLRAFVEHFWSVAWDLTDESPRVVQTLPHPSVHITFETGLPAQVGGVHRGRFTRTLAGRGRVFAIKFRPGGFYPYFKQPLSALTDRVWRLEDCFEPAADALHATIHAEPEDEARIALAESFLLARLPAPDPNVALIERIAAYIQAEPTLTRVDDLCAAMDIGKRTLQSLFKHYVGISPKWMIQRYRLHEALERLDGRPVPDWSDFALSLGYFDQAHFIKDFRVMVGMTPGEYSGAPTAVDRH